jgi:hypothetical protein
MSITTGPDNRINSNYNISGVVSDSLQLYYDPARFYSYSGNGPTIKDLSGNGRDLTMYTYGGTTYSSNPPQGVPFTTIKGGEFTFDGVNDFGILPSTLYPGTTFTVSAWIKTSATGELAIFSHCNGGPVNAAFTIASGRMRMMYYTVAWQIFDGSVTTINDGNWHYCVWSVNGTNCEYYLDNNLTDTTTLVGQINPSIYSLGSKWGPCNSQGYGPGTDGPHAQFNGQMGVIMVHSKELSDTEIEHHWDIFKFRYDL